MYSLSLLVGSQDEEKLTCKYVYLTVDNMEEYLGHTFVKMNADGYQLVTLDKAEKTSSSPPMLA